MRRVLTGYARTFNRRHHRHGYLFQNRYKSILCQEELYRLELVRYLGESEFVAAALAAGGEGLERRQRLRSHGDEFDWLLRRVAAVGLHANHGGTLKALRNPRRKACGGESYELFPIAALHFHFMTGTDGLEFFPEGVVDLS
jgi:hypothetical protein